MANSIDALTSPTLKYLRERWWNDDFTDFLAETLRPRPGNRILDVGCGEGTAEVRIGRLHVSQIRMVGVDLMIERVMVARYQTAGHNQRVAYATADACHLPFRDGVFDSTFCVAVLQHIGDVEAAVGEFARVTRSGGRVLAVEPDNSARYWYSATPAGVKAFETSMRFFSALAAARGEKSEAAVGPKASRALRASRHRAARTSGCSPCHSRALARRRRMSGHAAARPSRRQSSRRRPKPSGPSAESISTCSPHMPPKPPRPAPASSKSRTRCSLRPLARKRSEGYEGWDEYAPFYDWENARTLGRRDVPFWRTVAARGGRHHARARVRHWPYRDAAGACRRLARRHRSVGRDAGTRPQARDRARLERARFDRPGRYPALPFPASTFSLVIAPYGVLQSLLRERDLAATLRAVHGVLRPGGTFGVELVADLPSWDEYKKRVSLKGWKNRRGGAHVTLVETVRQDRARHLTIFDQEFTERIGRSPAYAPFRADVQDALGAADGPPPREGRL